MPALRIKIKKDRCDRQRSCLFGGSCQDKRLTVEEVDGKYFRHGGSGAPLLCPKEAVLVMGSAELGPVLVEKTEQHPEFRVGHEVIFGQYVGVLVPLEEAEKSADWGGQTGIKEGFVPLKLEEPFKDRSYFSTDPNMLKIA
jgi:hypothetical protein